MSFRCGLCGEVQPPGTKPVKVVTKIRKKEPRVKMRGDLAADYIEPWEIVKEVLTCQKCAANPRKPEIERNP